MSITRENFEREIRNIKYLNASEMDLLEIAYASRDVQNNIDYVSFCQDISNQNRSQNQGNQIVLNQDQVKLLQNVANKLIQEGLQVTLVQFLLMEDSANVGYLYDKSIKGAFDKTFKKAKSSNASSLSTKQVNDLLTCCNVDSLQRY